jgi:hypothetical protein
MIDLKPFYQKDELDAINCRTSKVGAVMPGGDQQMYYCVVDEVESSEVHYCEIEDYECRYLLPSAFESIEKEPEEETSYSANADPDLSSFIPLDARSKEARRRNDQPLQLTLDPTER